MRSIARNSLKMKDAMTTIANVMLIKKMLQGWARFPGIPFFETEEDFGFLK